MNRILLDRPGCGGLLLRSVGGKEQIGQFVGPDIGPASKQFPRAGKVGRLGNDTYPLHERLDSRRRMLGRT